MSNLKWEWKWHFAGECENPYVGIIALPDLLWGTSEQEDILRVVDFTHHSEHGGYAVIAFNDKYPARIETDVNSTAGFSQLEYFVHCATHNLGQKTAGASSVFTRYWKLDLKFKKLNTE